MADIRINSLPTTATSSSSGDFLAIDGAANGTRKLSAYSPTFGGNLTVSGTGTSSVAGNLGVGTASPLSRLNAQADNTNNDQAQLVISGATNSNKRLSVGFNTTGNYATIQCLIAGDNYYPLSLQPTLGNVLIGTTTDSSNGRLQLATHTTSAGGIGFGTDWSINRASSTNLWANNVAGGAAIFALASASVRKGYIYWDTADITLGTDAGSLFLDAASGVVKVTSGKAFQLGNAYVAGAPTATGYVTIKDSAGTTYKVLVST